MHGQPDIGQQCAIDHWKTQLRDTASLMDAPIAHHRALLQRAYALHGAQVIDEGELSDLLELADAAYAYAVEAALDHLAD